MFKGQRSDDNKKCSIAEPCASVYALPHKWWRALELSKSRNGDRGCTMRA